MCLSMICEKVLGKGKNKNKHFYDLPFAPPEKLKINPV